MLYTWILLTFFSLTAYGQLLIKPLKTQAATSGDVIEVELKLSDRRLMDVLTPSKLQASFIPESLWFMSVNTWQLSSEGLTTNARVVLGKKFAPDRSAPLLVGKQEVEVQFVNWQFTPGNDGEGEFLYQDVPWYYRPWWKKYGLYMLAAILFLGGMGSLYILRWRRKRLMEKLAREMMDTLMNKLEQARDITALSQIWSARDDFSSIFPGKEQSLRNFFDVLNQYQFKPSQKDNELQEILTAKRKLLEELKGGIHGV